MEQEIIKQAIKMRELQREYFRNRDHGILKATRAAEVYLDKMLHDYVNMIPPEVQIDNHPRLF